MKVITVLIEDREGKELASLETTDAAEADAAVARVRVWYPNAMVTRSEREEQS